MSSTRRRACRFAIALALVWALAPGAATAMEAPGSTDLTPRLAKLARPAVGSASHAAQASKLGLAKRGPGSLLRRGNRVLAYVRFARGALAGLGRLRAAGARIVDASGRYQTVTVAVKPADLRAVAAVAKVASVSEALAPVLACGSVTSEGDGQLLAAQARFEPPEPDGSGVTVGILSDSFDQATEAADGSGDVATHALQDEESGDLPGPASPCANKTAVDVLEGAQPPIDDESSDEGRAMAQIVHDLAPGAAIKFASAFNGEPSFAKNIGDLAAAGAQVIVDDVFYPEEPFFQDGPVAVAAREAVEGGATYLSAAGNDNLIDGAGNDVGSWEAPAFRDSGTCPPAVQLVNAANGKHCLDFNPGPSTDRTFGIRVEPETTLTVDLQWAEPWSGLDTDLDAFLLNANGNLIELDGKDNLKTQKPVEVVEWVNESSSARTVQLVVNRYAGGNPRLKFAFLQNGGGVLATEYPRTSETDTVGPTIFGHSGTATAISVGAVHYNQSGQVAGYSSRGPVRLEFGPVEGTEPAPALGAPELLSKPDLVATDCGATTFFAFFVTEEAKWRFCGTSASAPHAGAVAALMLETKPTATPAELRAALQVGAAAVGIEGPCAAGAGLVDAPAAIEELLSPVGGTPPVCEPPAAEVPDAEAAAAGDWGQEAPPVLESTPPPPPPGPTTTGDTEPASVPGTFFRQRPVKLVRTRQGRARVVFRFGSDQEGVTFVCQIDGAQFRVCPERLVKRLAPGWHLVRVSARNADGFGDQTPAAYRFRVKRLDPTS